MTTSRAATGMILAGFVTLSGASAMAGMIDESKLDPWEPCALCHSLDGISRMAKFPKLAAQPAGYIAKQLGDFRAHRRDNDGGQMQAMAGDLDDERLMAVAGYFSGLPAPPPGPMAEGGAALTGRTLTSAGDAERGLPACFSCHGADAVAASGAPRLEAQHPDYLTKQLRDFKEGRRRNDPGGVMRKVASMLTEDEAGALAAYLGGLERNARR